MVLETCSPFHPSRPHLLPPALSPSNMGNSGVTGGGASMEVWTHMCSSDDGLETRPTQPEASDMHTVTDTPHCHRHTTPSQTHHTVTDTPHRNRHTTPSQTRHTVTVTLTAGVPVDSQGGRCYGNACLQGGVASQVRCISRRLRGQSRRRAHSHTTLG